MKDTSTKGWYQSKALVYTVSTLAITLWGASYIWTNRLIALEIPISFFVFIRILIAGIVLLLFNAVCGRLVQIRKKDLPKFLLLAFCEPFIYFLCETAGLKETGSPTLSAMIIATIPIFSIAAGRIFFKEKVTTFNIFGIILCIMGIVIVTAARGALGERFMLGVILLLIAVVSEVGHASLTKSLSGNYTSQVIVMYQFLIGSVYLLPLFIFDGLKDFSPAYLRGEVWYPLLCLSVLCSSLAFSLWVSTIKSLGVAKSSIFSALIPVVAAIIAFVSGHETLTPLQIAGILVATCGVIMSQMTPRKRKVR